MGFSAQGLVLREKTGGCVLGLKVLPRAPRNRVVGVENGNLKLKIQAPPSEGQANEMTLEFLSELLGHPRKSMEIWTGLKSRNKSVFLKGLTPEQVLKSLSISKKEGTNG